MTDSPIESLIDLVQQTERVLRIKASSWGDALRYLEAFRTTRLMPIHHRHKRADLEPFLVVLIGLTNVGKSTLIEALLGVPVAPKRNGPATAVRVEYVHGTTWELEVFYHRATDRPVRRGFAQPDDLAREIARHVLDVSVEEAAKIAKAVVQGPFPSLPSTLKLTDTPGIGAARTSDAEIPLTLIDPDLLKKAGRCYLCVAAGAGWEVSPEEALLFAQISALCTNVLVTKWEGSPEDAEEWKSMFGNLFPGAEFEFVNARRDVNVARVRAILQGLASKERRLMLVRREVLRAWQDLQRHWDNVLHVPQPWPDFALQRFQVSCREYAELQPMFSSPHLR